MVNSMLMWREDLGSNPSSHTKNGIVIFVELEFTFFFQGLSFFSYVCKL